MAMGFCDVEETGQFRGCWQFYQVTKLGIVPLNYSPLRFARQIQELSFYF
jgi:hypothetical protein